jgi:hypothetical protein
MSTKSRERLYGVSIQMSAERAKHARKEADRLACEAWNMRMLGYKGPAQPSPTIGDALNAGYGYLEVRRLGCDTHQTVALDIIRRPKAIPIHELERYMRCKDCSQVRRYPYKRSHLVALRPTKISASAVEMVAGRALTPEGFSSEDAEHALARTEEPTMPAGDSSLQEFKMLVTTKPRPAIRTLRGWAISLLQEAGAIRECEEHGWMQDRADPHARERAFAIAREEPPPGVSPDAAAAEVREVLDSIGDLCPECPTLGA